MSAYNAKTIDTNDVAERVADELSDFHSNGLITGATLKSKTNYTNLIKAINTADREVCRDSQIHRLVVVYAPPERNTILFDQNSQYLANMIQGVQGADVGSRNLPYFINKHDYINVVEIFSRYLEVFSEYPTGGETASSHIRKVSPSELRQPSNTRRKATNDYVHQENEQAERRCAFLPEENRLLLDRSMTSGAFLRFEGRIFPGVINTSKLSDVDRKKTNYSAYKIVCPHTAHAFLIGAAVYHSLPISSGDARALAFSSMQREKRDYLKMKPRDSNVVVPVYHI